MDAFLKFLTDNAVAITTAIAVLVFLREPIGAFIKWILSRLQPARVDIKAYEVITDPAKLLPTLYNEENNSSPVAHHRIAYQPRDLPHDLQTALNAKPYLLIIAPTGIGKTREAARIVATLMINGWRVIRVKPGWLEIPKEPPPELCGNYHRLVILLDDLNQLFRSAPAFPSPRAEPGLVLSEASYHDRLLKFLEYFENLSGENEIRVIATARNETAQWQPLDYNPRDALWKKFHPPLELPPPPAKSCIELLNVATTTADIPADRQDFPAIVRTNDGTFGNLVLNLQRACTTQTPLTLASYTPKLGESWQDVYQRACAKFPTVRWIYDAVDLLRQARIKLYAWLVEPTALMLWGGNPIQTLMRRRQIHRALRYLVDERILATAAGQLAPRDGQIEAKGTETDWRPYAASLQKLVLRLADRHGDKIVGSLFGLGVKLYAIKQFDQLVPLMQKAIQVAPEDHVAWYNLGCTFQKLERYADAETAYRDALRLNPNDAKAHYNLACLESLRKNTTAAFEHLRRAVEQAEFDRALAWQDPDLQWLRSDPRFRDIVGAPPELPDTGGKA